jgi:hypothetical protein
MHGSCRGGASDATSSDDGGGYFSCLMCEMLCVEKSLGFNHKIMINILGVTT